MSICEQCKSPTTPRQEERMEKKRVLIVDDLKIRHEQIMEMRGNDCEYTNAYTYKKAVKALAESSFDEMFLDHDLGSKKDGRDLARVILTLKDKPEIITVHSWNLVAAKEMANILKPSGVPIIVMPLLQEGENPYVNM